MMFSSYIRLSKAIVFLCSWLLLVQCAPTKSPVLVPSYQVLPVDNSYAIDSLAEATILPYRQQLTREMDVTIGQSNKRLTKREVESLLGNFVSDAILIQSGHYFAGKIHMSVINNGGLRAPIPEGPVKLANVYELMPFENFLYILELNGSQTRALFDFLAASKRLAVANSVVIIDNGRPTKIFIDGAPFREDQTYVLAVPDFLAQGGDGMEFLKQATILEVTEVKIRDLIIEHIKEFDSKSIPIDAEVEGRVRLLP